MFNRQRFTGLHLLLAMLITLFMTIAIFGSPPNLALDVEPTTTMNFVPIIPTEVETKIPIYERDKSQGLTPEAESGVELTLQWRIIDSESEALISDAITTIQIVTVEGIEEFVIEGAELEFTMLIGTVVRWKSKAPGYEEHTEWNEMKPKLNNSGTITGNIRLVPLGKQA